MTVTRFKIRGVSYVQTTHDDGTVTCDPPLPEVTSALFERNRESFKDGLKMGVCAKPHNTDTSFHQGRKTIREQFQDDLPWLRRFEKEYRKQTGQSLPKDGVWLGQLADSAFDAKAVIRPGEGRKEVDRLAQRMADKHRKMADAPPVRLADDLAQEKMDHYRATGEAASMTDRELKEFVIEKHGSKV